MASGLIAAKDIPTISALYRSGKLRPSPKEDLPTPTQQYNDKISTIQADITKLQIDAIVNAANRGLRGGAGVDGAIQRAAGPQLLEECATLGGCETGSAKITGAYKLPCKKVIHAVGPIFSSIEKSEPLLRGCYRKSLSLAVENDCKTIAFPAISTGVYGYPSEDAARAAVREVYSFLKRPEGQKLEKIIFCNFMDKDVEAYAEVLPTVFPPTKEDLSHTGEYALNGSVTPKDQMPTVTQTRARAIFESTDKPQVLVLRGGGSQNSDLSLDRQISRAAAGERVVKNDKMMQHGEGDGHGKGTAVDGKATDETDATTLCNSDNDPEDDDAEDAPCTHTDFYGCPSTPTHGMWPAGALICWCGKYLFAARTSQVAAIGRRA